MKKSSAVLVLLAALSFLNPAEVRARCLDYVLVGHNFGSYFRCVDTSSLSALAYQITDPLGTNTGPLDIVCEEATGDGGYCSFDGGVSGDGIVTIRTDWSDTRAVGCPAVPPLGIAHRIAIIVQAADGKGLIVSLSGADPNFGYWAELAQPSAYPADPPAFPLDCSDQGGQPQILSLVEPSPGHVFLALHVNVPLVFSDCDPTSLGGFLTAGGYGNTCPDAFQANPAVGGLYTSVQSCSGAADLRRSLWLNTGVVPDPNGNATLSLTLPTGTDCLLVGATSIIGGYESGGITGFVRLQGTPCVDADHDDYLTCTGDCNDARDDVHPGAPEVCDQTDNDCDGVVDEGATGADIDSDGVPGACDTCPTIPNPGQDPAACDQRIESITISSSSPLGRGSGTVAWTTTHEVDVSGFNIVVFDAQGNRTPQNPVPIGCEECITGDSHQYTYFVPKHKSGKNIYVELIRTGGIVEIWGPAIRQ